MTPDWLLQVGEDPTEASSSLCDHLGIDLLPTVQFWRGGVKVWEHKGLQQMEQDLGEGGCWVKGTHAWAWTAPCLKSQAASVFKCLVGNSRTRCLQQIGRR